MSDMMSTADRMRNGKRGAPPADLSQLSGVLATLRDEITAAVLSQVRQELSDLRALASVAAELRAALEGVGRPQVTVQVPPQPTPIVNVDVPDVRVDVPVGPAPEVRLMPRAGTKKITVHRDARGAIEGATVSEG